MPKRYSAMYGEIVKEKKTQKYRSYDAGGVRGKKDGTKIRDIKRWKEKTGAIFRISTKQRLDKPITELCVSSSKVPLLLIYHLS